MSSYYEYFNPNPKGLETGDCIIRSLCKVTNLSWYDVFDKLIIFSRENCIMPNEGDSKMLEQMMNYFGLTRCKIPKPQKGMSAYNVLRFCKEHPSGKYVIRLARHVIGVVDGKIYDLHSGWLHSQVYTYYQLK